MRHISARSRGNCARTPNDPKLSDRGVRRGTCTVGGKAAVEAGAVTHGAVRCSAWLGPVRIWVWQQLGRSKLALNLPQVFLDGFSELDSENAIKIGWNAGALLKEDGNPIS